MKEKTSPTFKDFPPLYLLLFLCSAGLSILWGFVWMGGYQLSIIKLPSLTSLAKLDWPVILLQFFFSVLTFIDVLKYALLRIQYKTHKENAEAVIESLQQKLRKYEPEVYDMDGLS